ncbi:hypothetical protein MESS2_1000018 [Mesorhizobium metallidurans STM 2683]|uniref:Uncharacterized protein n=1 Tax=Mesorhizobium metallidurans STM 2683 TaxID=1297569 RepID=M5EED3_9HYPH|nr:hypothetical protein [Mesorhizobium metallidurans]CCV03004.1 hypothetical protein MESS2_1000018 [Mesorhizobium metallidurans STM 2683]
MAVAELFLERQFKVDAERTEALKTVGTRQEDLAGRRRAIEVAERREDEWLAGVAEALKGTWLENGISAPGVGGVLDQLAELSKCLQDRDAMQLRIDKMEADRDNFLVEVTAVAAEAGEAADDNEPEQLAIRLAERLERAERTREAKASLVNDLQRLQDGREILDAEISAHERRKNEVLSVFGVATLSEVVQRDELLRDRDRLRTTVAELEEQVSSELAVEGFEQARSILDAVDLDSLAIEKAEAEQRLHASDEAIRQQLIRQTRATDKLDAIGGDSAVARIDAERRTVLLEIEEKAVRYIELKLGIMSAGNALRLYRERHRSGMMERASARPVFWPDNSTCEGWGSAHRVATRWTIQGRRRAIKGRALSALSGAQACWVLRVCAVSAVRALHRRRHHGNLRPCPFRGGLQVVWRNGKCRSGDLSYASPAPM